MAATVTLATTTLQQPIGPGDTALLPASLSGLLPGIQLYIDAELLHIVDPTLPGGWVKVLRGRAGTATTAHASSALITIGRADQFYDRNPVGSPQAAEPVQPWINVVNGTIWVPQGDETGPNQARYWRQVTTTYGISGLGSRTAVQNPTYAGAITS